LTYSKTKALERGIKGVKDGKFKKVPIAVSFKDHISPGGISQKACINCGGCVTGCNKYAKNTTLMNYLPDAVRNGCEIFCTIKVMYFEKQEKKWIVHCVKIFNDDSEKEFSITCDNLVIASGSLGSTEILLRSKEKGLKCSKMVGQKFSGNGDYIASTYNGEEECKSIGYLSSVRNTIVGPTITSNI
jgi:cholesterol oxidase